VSSSNLGRDNGFPDCYSPFLQANTRGVPRLDHDSFLKSSPVHQPSCVSVV
jgi:hypothetical protein